MMMMMMMMMMKDEQFKVTASSCKCESVVNSLFSFLVGIFVKALVMVVCAQHLLNDDHKMMSRSCWQHQQQCSTITLCRPLH